MNTVILCDFDGTITMQDTLVKILDTFAESDWRAIERRIGSEEFGNRIGLKQEFALCDPKKVTQAKIIKLLNNEIEIDPYFKQFLEFSARENYEFVIVSGGFSLCIETVLKKYQLGRIPHYSNEILFKKNGLEIENPYSSEECNQCGNCKTMHLRKYRSMGYYIIYIGDSTTDRCPSRYADLVFAKGHLSTYCLREKIDHVVYENFSDIQAYLLENAAADLIEMENNNEKIQ